MKTNKWKDIFWCVLAGFCLGGGLAGLDLKAGFWRGWLAYGLLFSLGSVMLLFAWRWAGSRKWLGLLLLLTFFLRLGLGVGLSKGLPISGYDTEVQRAGYNSVDAYHRDLQSWDLADSDRPLMFAFDKTYAIDQYGGLEFLSALVYRTLSPDGHRPWLVIGMAALVASLGVVFFWKAAGTAWNEKLASLAVWIFALTPESLWWGSSQMREPFLISFISMGLWGVVKWQADQDRKSLGWALGGVVGLLLFSPGVAIYMTIILVGWVWLRSRADHIPWRTLAIASGVLVIAALLLWVGLSRGALQGAPLVETITNWFKYSVKWDIYQLENESGVIQHLFSDHLDPRLKLPFIFGYGLAQPVLPAVLFDPAPGIWKTIGILRSLGWYLYLPFLIFNLVAILKIPSRNERTAWIWLFITTWIWIAVSALRAGGDQWDNPRYRLIFLVFQALLVAKAWLAYQETHHPMLIRIGLIELVFLLFFTDWYAFRYFRFIPRFSFTTTIGLIVLAAILILSIGFIVDKVKNARKIN